MKKIVLHKHIPAFAEGLEPVTVEADTAGELLATPWVASWGRDDLWARRVSDPDEAEALGLTPELDIYWQFGKEQCGTKYIQRGVTKFFRFSISDDLLMVEQDEGRRWWVVGRFISGAEFVDLPKWKPVYEPA